MLGWFKRKKSFLENWDFEALADFKVIQNPDSLQYVNKDASKVIYFSALNVSGGSLFPIDSYSGEPMIKENAGGWQLKGTKIFENQILICIISVVRQEDIDWAKTFFDSITTR